MSLLTALGIFNYGLVLIYGLYLSTFISGGWQNSRQKHLIFILCPCFLLIQSPCWLLFGADTVKQLYPLIVHLPLVLILIFALKKPVGIALVSVCTAYLCCQLPRWVNLLVSAFSGSPLAGEISYMLFIAPIFWLLYRFFVRPAYDAMTASPHSLLLFGSLPVAYYFFDYGTVIYSDALNMGIRAISESLPTALIVFYVIFLSAYHKQMQTRANAELQRSMLEAELKQAAIEVESLRAAATQVAIYQHDMRHHLNAIDGFLAVGEQAQARAYIQKVRADVETITRRRFCANELVNLLCSSFSQKAERAGVKLTIESNLPKELSLPDTELCSILSNGLENALRAVEALPAARRHISLYCGLRRGKLLIEITNPCAADFIVQDDMPSSDRGAGHGYGCRSISSIAERRHGLCSVRAADGTFVLRVMLPETEQHT